MNNHGQIERDRGNEVRITQEYIYRTSVNLDRSRCREVLSQVSSFKSFDRCSYQDVSRGVHSKASSMDRGAIEETEDMLIDPPSCRGAIEIAIKTS